MSTLYDAGELAREVERTLSQSANLWSEGALQLELSCEPELLRKVLIRLVALGRVVVVECTHPFWGLEGMFISALWVVQSAPIADRRN